MFGFSTIKLYLFGSISIALLTTGALLYNDYNRLKNERDQLIATESTLRATQKAQELTINEMEGDRQRLTVINKNLQIGLEEARSEANRLNKLFREHDLTKLATEKPVLIEKRINDATKNVFSDIESITSR